MITGTCLGWAVDPAVVPCYWEPVRQAPGSLTKLAPTTGSFGLATSSWHCVPTQYSQVIIRLRASNSVLPGTSKPEAKQCLAISHHLKSCSIRILSMYRYVLLAAIAHG